MIRIVIALLLLAGPAWGQGWELGFQNSDGSQDSYNTTTGEYKMGFENPDGSQDTYNTTTGEWEYGYKNPDGSQDTYKTGGHDYGDEIKDDEPSKILLDRDMR